MDFRYQAGYPHWRDALRLGIDWVRCISLPEMEGPANEYITHGIKVLAVFTGESNDAGLYVMQNATALSIGNEPQFAMDGAASWPSGTSDDFVNVWSHVANVVVQGRIPLVGPGIWSQDYAKWAEVAHRLPGLSASSVHVYPEPSGHTDALVRKHLASYKAVRPDLPLICGEWTMRGTRTLPTYRSIDLHCDSKFWFCWGPGVPGHELVETPELGILTLAG